MKQNRLLHIETVEILSTYSQAFHFFLNLIWEDVSIEDIRTHHHQCSSVDISLPAGMDDRKIMAMWKEWKEHEMHELYAIKN